MSETIDIENALERLELTFGFRNVHMTIGPGVPESTRFAFVRSVHRGFSLLSSMLDIPEGAIARLGGVGYDMKLKLYLATKAQQRRDLDGLWQENDPDGCVVISLAHTTRALAHEYMHALDMTFGQDGEPWSAGWRWREALERHPLFVSMHEQFGLYVNDEPTENAIEMETLAYVFESMCLERFGRDARFVTELDFPHDPHPLRPRGAAFHDLAETIQRHLLVRLPGRRPVRNLIKPDLNLT